MASSANQTYDNCATLRNIRHTYVKLSAFYHLGAKRPPYTDVLPMLRRLVDAFGAEAADVGDR